jgi:hypothetical protein
VALLRLLSTNSSDPSMVTGKSRNELYRRASRRVP